MNIDINGVECWYCGKVAHVKAECYRRNRDKRKEDAEKSKGDKVVVALLKQDKPPRDFTVNVSHFAYIDSVAIAHMMHDKSFLPGTEVWLNSTIATAGKGTSKEKTQAHFMMKMSSGQKSFKLNWVFHVAKLGHILICVWRLYD